MDGPGSGDDQAGLRIDHIAKHVDGGYGGDDEAVADIDGGAANAGFHGLAHAQDLAYRAAGAGTHVALGGRARGGVQASLVAHGSVGAHVGAADAQVEEDGGGHNGDTRHAHVEPTPRSSK